MSSSPSLQPSTPPASAKPIRRRDALELARTILPALLVAMILRTALFQPFTIPSSSMEPGLVTGDYIVVSKFAYGWSRASLPFNPPLPAGRLAPRPVRRGDVAVFRLPRMPGKTLIKRIVGLPGDTVQVRGGRLIVNGRALSTQALGVVQDHDRPSRLVPLVREIAADGSSRLIYAGAPQGRADETGVYRVPPGCYFAMGDNRDNSLDSRWPRETGVGYLPAEYLVGRAEFVLASWKPGASLLKPWTWLNLQWDRFLRPIR